MTAEDRVAIILGRAIMRAEALAAELEKLREEQEHAADESRLGKVKHDP